MDNYLGFRELFPTVFNRHPDVIMDVGGGWRVPLLTLFAALEGIALKDPRFHVSRVKEQLGGLRVHYTPRSNHVDALVFAANARCIWTCEVCGDPGWLEGARGWLRSRCSVHVHSLSSGHAVDGAADGVQLRHPCPLPRHLSVLRHGAMNYYSDFPHLYPVIFDRTPDLTISAGPGWKQHLRPLFSQLEEFARATPGFRVLQAKEKLGGFRIYYSPHHPVLDFFVRQTETSCASTCDVCGAAGVLVSGAARGLRTRCSEHENSDLWY